VEIFEDCGKYEKTLGGENSNFRDKFGDPKIVGPPFGGDRQIQKIFLNDFDTWNVKIGICIRKLWLFYEQTPN